MSFSLSALSWEAGPNDPLPLLSDGTHAVEGNYRPPPNTRPESAENDG